MRFFSLTIGLCLIGQFANASFQLSVVENHWDKSTGEYTLVYQYKNNSSDDFEYHLQAKNVDDALVIDYKSTNLSKGVEVSSGTSYFPKTDMSQIDLGKNNNGAMFYPNQKTRAAVIRLHGSEGGVDALTHAKTFFMAQNGFTAYAYCYFNCPFGGAPSNLHRVVVSKVYEDLVILKTNQKVAISGGSRGAELTATLASVLAANDLIQADAYIADRPAHVTVPAYFYYYDDPSNWKNGETWKRPIQQNWIGAEDGPHKPKQGWIWTESQTAFQNNQPIAIETNKSPYLNIHGTDDSTWPVQLSMRLERRIPADKKQRFVQTEGDAIILSSKLFQFHYFDGVDHGFEQKWAQIGRAELSLKFLRKYLQP